MGLLRRVEIRGYRSIVRASLRLGEITTIVGPSDSGKSNVVRALRDAFFNAQGESFCTEGLNVTRVAFAIGRNHKVIWEKECGERSGSSKYFHTNAETGTKLVFEKTGRTVPAEIVDVTGVRALQIDDELSLRVNFAEQSEAWFLLSNPPWTSGKVTKVIGKVSGVDAMILANRDLVTTRMTYVREVRASRERAEKARGELLAFHGLDGARALVERAGGALGAAQADRQRIAEATRLLRAVQEKRQRLQRARELTVVARAALERAEALGLLEDLVRLREADALAARLADLSRRRTAVQERVKAARAGIAAAAQELIALAGGDELTCPLCGETLHEECRRALLDQAKKFAVPQTEEDS